MKKYKVTLKKNNGFLETNSLSEAKKMAKDPKSYGDVYKVTRVKPGQDNLNIVWRSYKPTKDDLEGDEIVALLQKEQLTQEERKKYFRLLEKQAKRHKKKK